MATLRQVAVIFLSLALGAGAGHAASSAETRAYAAAVKAYEDHSWGFAEAAFAAFAAKYPKSERRAEAVFWEARAQIELGKFAQAIALLEARSGEAGAMADQYLYWTGEAQSKTTNYAAAAEAFGKLAREFPTSALRLGAAVSEASARAKLGDWPRVVELLQNTGGAFRQAAAANPTSELTAQGQLLLAEALLAQKNYSGTDVALQPLELGTLKPELDWRKKYLRAQMQIGAGQFEAATNTCEELVAAAEKTGRSDFRAESFALQGEVLERLSRRDDAIAAFKHNLGSDTPAERQRQALLKVSELLLAQNRLAEAGDTLERFLAQFTNSPATDMALLTLGELHLKQHVAATTNGVNGVTNHLALAEAQLDRLIGTFTNSALLGKAELDRGWCYWVSHRVPESAVAFARAAGRLSDSEDLAIARFKLGDALFEQNDFAGAAKKYRGALDLFAHWPRLGESLRPQALYQLLRASCAATNLADADDAMKQILQLPAGGAVAERSVLLAGQAHTEAGDPIKAREVFAQFTALFPESPLRPEVELAIARTHEQQDDWTGAVNNYTSWLERYETNALRPQAEFQLALANFRAGNETNALNLFTNFVAQYPTNKALAPRAQWWVADYYYGLGGANYGESEKNYKKIFQDWPDSELAFEARMMAGRAAVGRSVYADAIGHFTNLTGNLKCPPGLWTQAMFAYGDVLMSWATTDTNKLANYEEALKVFGKIQQRFPGSEAAVLAWGEMAKCYRQKGEATNATFAFSQVMTSAVASVSARGEAQVGLALLQEEQAQKLEGEEQRSLLTQALNNYLEVFYEVIPSREGETRNLRWVKEAGLKAVRVTETLGQWDQMERLCRRLATLVPQLQESLDKKIAKAREQLAAKKSE